MPYYLDLTETHFAAMDLSQKADPTRRNVMVIEVDSDSVVAERVL